jgi:hypothetical protein
MDDDFCVKKPSKKYFSVTEDIEQEAMRAFSQAASVGIPQQEKVREVQWVKPNPFAELDAKNQALRDLRYEMAVNTIDPNQVLVSHTPVQVQTRNIVHKEHQSLIQRSSIGQKLAAKR